MDLTDYLGVLRKRWSTIVLIALLTLGAAVALTLAAVPQYTATTRMFFAAEGGESISDLNQGSTFAERQMVSYAAVAASPMVLDPVIEDLDLDVQAHELAEALTATILPNSVILDISATDEDPQLAADLADAVADELSAVAEDLSPERSDGTQPVQATIVTEARVPTEPSAPNTVLNVALGLVFGVLLGTVTAVARELLDTKVRGAKDVTALTGVPVMATVQYETGSRSSPTFMVDDPHGSRAEDVRRLRTNLRYVGLDHKLRSIVVTSSLPGEGKSTTSIALSLALADTGARVLLVDADLRRPSVAEYLGLEGAAGLTTVLIGRAESADVVQRWRRTGLDVLPAGDVPPNPSELLGSRAMATLLVDLMAAYDIVVVDSPPLLPVTDAAVLGKLAGGTLVVAGADKVHKAQLREALDALDQVGAHVLGVVLNKVGRRDANRYGYESYRSRGPGETPRRPESPAEVAAELGVTRRVTRDDAEPGSPPAGTTLPV